MIDNDLTETSDQSDSTPSTSIESSTLQPVHPNVVSESNSQSHLSKTWAIITVIIVLATLILGSLWYQGYLATPKTIPVQVTEESIVELARPTTVNVSQAVLPTTQSTPSASLTPQPFKTFLRSWNGQDYYLKRLAYEIDPNIIDSYSLDNSLVNFNISQKLDLIAINSGGEERLISHLNSSASSANPVLTPRIASAPKDAPYIFLGLNEWGTGGFRGLFINLDTGEEFTFKSLTSLLGSEFASDDCTILVQDTTQNQLVLVCNSNLRKNEFVASYYAPTNKIELIKQLTPRETMSCEKDYDNVLTTEYTASGETKIAVCDLGKFNRIDGQPLEPLYFITVTPKE